MNTSQKILICGFPHCGTSILKSIIGHIEEVEEIFNETNIINKTSNKKFIFSIFPVSKESKMMRSSFFSTHKSKMSTLLFALPFGLTSIL